ncbi:hypothetical protein AgCh_025090 [Apium graveolens]
MEKEVPHHRLDESRASPPSFPVRQEIRASRKLPSIASVLSFFIQFYGRSSPQAVHLLARSLSMPKGSTKTESAAGRGGRRPSESRIILLVVRVSSLVLRPEEEAIETRKEGILLHLKVTSYIDMIGLKLDLLLKRKGRRDDQPMKSCSK